MANSFHIPSGNLRELRPGFSRDSSGRQRASSLEAAPQEDNPSATQPLPSAVNGNLIGPRKLVRPKLPLAASRERSFPLRNESPILAHQPSMSAQHDDHTNASAEAFYFQKQVQTQTLMVFVLEDGERLEGYIEWYDRNAIKIRNGSRTLVYKSAIKYLYKASDIQSPPIGTKKAR
jgi:sRNA-binding regulator protein Hfq